MDLLIYKIHYSLIKKTHKLLGIQNCNFVCRKCLNSYTNQNVSVEHKQQCDEQPEVTSIKNSNESHMRWKKQFHNIRSYFSIIADLEADNEVDITSIGKQTTNF